MGNPVFSKQDERSDINKTTVKRFVRGMASTDVTHVLKGKIIKKPTNQIWMIDPKAKVGEHKYTCERDLKWSPYNSNLHMQSIKVLVKAPVPEHTVKGDSFEDTMMLLAVMKEKQSEENKNKKEERIREMAMELKKKKEEKTCIKLSF